MPNRELSIHGEGREGRRAAAETLAREEGRHPPLLTQNCLPTSRPLPFPKKGHSTLSWCPLPKVQAPVTSLPTSNPALQLRNSPALLIRLKHISLLQYRFIALIYCCFSAATKRMRGPPP